MIITNQIKTYNNSNSNIKKLYEWYVQGDSFEISHVIIRDSNADNKMVNRVIEYFLNNFLFQEQLVTKLYRFRK